MVVWGGWGKRWRGLLYRIGAPGDAPFCRFEVRVGLGVFGVDFQNV